VLRRTYDWTMRLAAHRHAGRALAAVSFIESSVFPVPPDALLIPMCLANRQKAWTYALICTIASVAGGLFGYAIGYYLFELVGEPVLNFYGYLDRFETFVDSYNAYGWWIVFGAGLTPFPYKLITIASGVTQLDLVTFTVASVVARGGRFFLVAAALWYFGPPIREVLERRLGLITALFFALLLGGFVAVRYLG